jgi:hypothetical protein
VCGYCITPDEELPRYKMNIPGEIIELYKPKSVVIDNATQGFLMALPEWSKEEEVKFFETSETVWFYGVNESLSNEGSTPEPFDIDDFQKMIDRRVSEALDESIAKSVVKYKRENHDNG